MDQKSQSTRRRFAELSCRFLLWLMVSAVFTLIVVQYSLRFGRLLIYPAYDDVVYLLDGLRRLNSVHANGPLAFFTDWVRRPPHAPLSTLLALLSFLLLGVHDWAPYAANVVIVVTLVGFTDCLMRPASAMWRIAAVLFVLSTPVAAEAVHEFRPDIAAGLFTAIAVFILLDVGLIERSAVRSLAGGIFFGLALVAKPTVFPLTILVSMWALICSMGRNRLLDSPRQGAALRAGGLFILPAVLIAGPHYLIGRRQILGYIRTTEFGRWSNIWAFRGTPLDHAMFYLNGYGAQVMLGDHRFILLAIFAVGSLHLLMTRERAEIVNATAYFAAIFVSYLVPTLNWNKQQFLGLVFDWSIIFAALVIMRHLIEAEHQRQTSIPWARALLASACVAGVFLFQWPAFQSRKEIAHAPQRKQIDDRIMAAIVQHAGPGINSVMVTTGGYVNADLFDYLALKRKLPLTFRSSAFRDDLEEHRESWSRMDFVVVAQPGDSESARYVPSYPIQGQLLAALRSLPNFVQIAAVPDLNDRCFFVFQNLGRIPLRQTIAPESCAQANANRAK